MTIIIIIIIGILFKCEEHVFETTGNYSKTFKDYLTLIM